MQAQRKVIVFIAAAIGLYLAWYILYDFWLLPHTRVNPWLNGFTAQAGAGLLHLFGFQAQAQQARVLLEQQGALRIGDTCNGLEFFVLFAGFILVFPGSWRKKFYFIPIGVLIIFLLNVLRVAVLSLNYHLSRHTFDFNHKYTYSFFIYLIIFGMWMLWVNRFSGLKHSLNSKE